MVKVTFLVSGLSCSSLSLSRDTVSRLVRAGRAGLTEEVWEVSALFLQVRERMRARPRQRVTTLTALVTRTVRNVGS